MPAARVGAEAAAWTSAARGPDMPIDTGIWNLAGRGVKSVADYDTEYAQARQNRLTEAMGLMKMDEYRRGVEDNKLLRTALSAPDADPYKVLLRSGNIKGATDFQKSKNDTAESASKVAKEQVETGQKKSELVGQVMGWVRQNPTLENAKSAIDHLVSVGGLPQDRAQTMFAVFQADPSPQGVAKFSTMAYQASLQAKDQLPKLESFNAGDRQVSQAIDPITGKPTETGSTAIGQSANSKATDARIAAEGAANRGVQLRGQDLVNARAKEAANVPRGQIVETDGGFMLADPRAGTAKALTGPDGQPLKGKAANRQMTDSQAKANLFGSRMEESHRIISDLEGQYSPMGVNAKVAAGEVPIVGGAAGFAGNLMLSGKSQQAEQAQRDFINAVLRRESGAVISQPEFENARKQYFPQPGDKSDNLAQKKRNRALAIQGMAAEVPGGLRHAPGLTNPGQSGAADGGWKIEKVN